MFGVLACASMGGVGGRTSFIAYATAHASVASVLDTESRHDKSLIMSQMMAPTLCVERI